ncbi:MAG: mechanosensitive ion channel family protein [Vibrio sp.]
MRLLISLLLTALFFSVNIHADEVKDASAAVEKAAEDLGEVLEEAQDPKPTLSENILDRADEVQSLFDQAKHLTGDNLTIVQVSWYDKNIKLREFLDNQINDKTDEALVEPLKKLVDLQVSYADFALTKSKAEIEKQMKAIEEASKEQRLLLQIHLNEARSFQVEMYKQQYENLLWLERLGEDKSAEIKALKQDVSALAKFTAASLHFSRLRQQTLQNQIDTLPPDQVGQFQLDLIYRQRNMEAAGKRLKKIIDVADPMGIETVDLKNQLFAATGQITHELLNWQVFKVSTLDYLNTFKRWLVNNTPNLLFNVFIFAVLMLITRFVARIVQAGVANMVSAASQLKMSHLMQNFLTSMSSKLIYCLGILFALAQVGLDLTPVLAGFGVAGIIIGFALQDTLSNFASGMMLLIYRPFDVGDWVFAAGVEGKVSKVSLVNTTIRTFDNEVLLIPNSKIWGDVIINRTFERVRRVDMVFGIAYSDSIEEAEKILIDVVESDSRVLRAPEYMVALDTLGDSSVNFIVRPWVRTDDYMDVMREMTREVKLRFDAAGINIPFPQRDVHLHIADSDKEFVIRDKTSIKES